MQHNEEQYVRKYQSKLGHPFHTTYLEQQDNQLIPLDSEIESLETILQCFMMLYFFKTLSHTNKGSNCKTLLQVLKTDCDGPLCLKMKNQIGDIRKYTLILKENFKNNKA